MLNNAGPVHAVHVRQRNGFYARFVDAYVDEADAVVKVVAEDGGGDEGDDCVGRFELAMLYTLLNEGLFVVRGSWFGGKDGTVVRVGSRCIQTCGGRECNKVGGFPLTSC